MNTLKALKRSTLGLDLYLWMVYRTFALRCASPGDRCTAISGGRTRPKPVTT